jgi:hypothetical protein
VGFIPLQYREQRLNARVTVPVVYENAVGVAEGLRGRGIGTRMIDEAARFMADRVDALMVIRGGERSDGYRFYRKTGHGDLMYARRYNLPAEAVWPQADDTGIGTVDREGWVALEPDLLALYDRVYGRFGGGRERNPGYWDLSLSAHVYRERKWWCVTLSDGERQDVPGRLAGYLVAAQGTWADTPDVYVYEVVGESGDVVERLLRYAYRFAVESGEDGRAGYGVAAVSLANPVRDTLRRLGFAEGESTPHVMVRVLRPDRMFRRLAADSSLARECALTVATPHRTLVVNDPERPRYSVRIETKESLLSRLFFCRLDLSAALDMELVRWNVHDLGLRRELCDVFAFSEWVQWFTDYV